MRKKHTAFTLVLVLGLAGGALGFPSHDFASRSFGVEYRGMLRGQAITEQDINSSSQFHGLSVAAAPFSFLVCKAGMGIEDFTVEKFQQNEFNGRFGPAPFGGIALITPVFIDIIQVAGGIDASYLYSSDKRGNLYSGAVVNPFFGLSLRIGPYFGLQGGGKGHFIAGSMTNTKTNADFGSFSNRNIVRAYGEAIFKSARDGGYISLFAEASPSLAGWDNGPVESTFGVTLGVIVKGDKKSDAVIKKSKDMFPEFEKMRDRTKDLEKDMAGD